MSAKTLSRFQRYRRYALGGLLVAAFLSLLVVRSAWGEGVHEIIETAGLGLIVAGILGRMWCTLYIGGRKAREIVELGPYSITRNPLYVFSSIAAAGVGAQTGSLVLAGLFFLGCALSFHLVIGREETYLRTAFGSPYRSYTERVPRFVPDFRLFRDEPVLTVSTGRLYRTLGDGLMFLIAIPAFEAVEHLQNLGLLQVSLKLY